MKKSIYSISQHTDLKRKDIENGLFEAADLLLYIEPQLAATAPQGVVQPLHAWMDNNKTLLTALTDLRLKQLTKSAGTDDFYIQLYKQRFIPERFHNNTDAE